MTHIDVPIRIFRGDVIVLDGTAMRIQAVDGDAIQIAYPAASMDSTIERDDLERRVANAEDFSVYR